MKIKKGSYVVVTTDKKGVFAGVLKEMKSSEVLLTEASMCVYWSAETMGVLGLASLGPQKGSKVSPQAPEIFLNGVTGIFVCSKKAQKLWGEQPWG